MTRTVAFEGGPVQARLLTSFPAELAMMPAKPKPICPALIRIARALAALPHMLSPCRWMPAGLRQTTQLGQAQTCSLEPRCTEALQNTRAHTQHTPDWQAPAQGPQARQPQAAPLQLLHTPVHTARRIWHPCSQARTKAARLSPASRSSLSPQSPGCQG